MLSFKKIIRIGDKTDHGGIVVTGISGVIVSGVMVSGVGDLVSCPKCQGVFPIIDGASLVTYSNRKIAFEGMKTACGAKLIASLN